MSGNVLTFNNVGDIAPHTSEQLFVTIKIADDSGGGLFTNTADVTSECGSGTGGRPVPVLTGTVTVTVPKVGPRPVAPPPPPVARPPLPRTGGTPVLPIVGALLAGSALLVVATRRYAGGR